MMGTAWTSLIEQKWVIWKDIQLDWQDMGEVKGDPQVFGQSDQENGGAIDPSRGHN